MLRIVTSLFIISLISLSIYAQPKEEVRAVWLTTNYNLDWPKTTGAAAQKAELITLLNKLQAANFNTIYLQVRSRGDLLYPSSKEPWAICLTGTMGGNPGYDPLQFAIEECHKRGMELHAWWNVYKVWPSATLPSNTNPQHILLSHPSWIRKYVSGSTTEWWLDPGLPEVRNYLVDVAMEMVRNYNIDAIHFDFIRYPGKLFSDTATYNQYGQGMNWEDWRRENINKFVTQIYDSIRAVKPRVKVGSAPIGIYVNIPGVSGWQSYYDIYQDSKRWVMLKKHDYLAPQTYWAIGGNQNYALLADWWVNNVGKKSTLFGRHLYLANAVYNMAPSELNWPASEILNQIDTGRYFGSHGQSYFRTEMITSNLKSIYDLIKANQYKYPANIYSMPWKDSVRASTPANLTITTTDSLTYYFKWRKSLPASDGDTAYYYNLYCGETSPVDISDIKNVVRFKIMNDTTASYTFASKPVTPYYFVVTAYDPGYNESFPSNQVGINISDVNDIYAVNIFHLEQNYPNPFNPSTKIKYRIEQKEFITLKVFDMLGREITTLVNEEKLPGVYEVEFISQNGNLTLPNGIYFYRLQAGNFSATRKMILLK